jgi:hypothetical protein
MLPLQIGQLPPFHGVVEELVVGEDGARHDVGSHANLLGRMQRLQLRIDGWSPAVRAAEPEVYGDDPRPLPVEVQGRVS